MTDLEALKSSDYKTQEEAFGKLKEKIYPIVYCRLGYSFPQEVDDVVMDAMMEVYNEIDDQKTEEDLDKAIARISFCNALDRLDKLTAKKRGGGKTISADQLREESGHEPFINRDDAPKGFVEEPHASPYAPQAGANHLANLNMEDVRKIVETLEKQLKLEHKQALQDYVAGLSFKEISEKRGWPIGTALSNVHRAQKAMRELRKKHPQLSKELMQYIVSLLL